MSPRIPRTQVATWSRWALTLLLGCVFLNGGCDDNGVGRPCEIGPIDPGQENQTLVRSPVLECPSRICLLPRQDSAALVQGTGSLCTAECSSNSDCEGETGKATGDTRCDSGFVCGVATVTGDYACRKLCICKDFLPNGKAKDEPACK